MATCSLQPKKSIAFLALVLAAYLLGIALAGCQASEPPQESPSAAKATAPSKSTRPDLLVVAEEEPWMAAVAAPVAAKYRRQGRLPLLVAVSFPPSRQANWLISRAGGGKTVLLGPSETKSMGPVLPSLSPEVLSLGVDPVYGSLRVARRFWDQTRLAVIAPADDPEAILVGSSLAGSRSAPLLIRQRKEGPRAMMKAVAELNIEEVLAVVSDPVRLPRWADGKDRRVRIVTAREAQDEVLGRLGPQNVRTVVLARVPDQSLCVGQTAWLAPYLGLVRGAPLVLCRSASAKTAEEQVVELIDRHELKPQTATILADYASIDTQTIEIDGGPQSPARAGASVRGGGPARAAAADEARKKYLVAAEPCTAKGPQQPVVLGVGRIPLPSLAGASVMFARGLVRQAMLSKQPPRVLMVSNAGVTRRPLPLGELVSRVTAQEFKNCRMPIDEFYGKFADSPEILAAARKASLLIYEGHVAYQDLIYVPYQHEHAPDSYYEEALGMLENSTPDVSAPPPAPAAAGNRPSPPPVPDKPNRLEEPLERMPLAVLQSCDSLDEALLDRVDELGCVGVIGSITPIHSGSGSILAHALVNGLLYRGDTVGQSLRDAQNYLLCLADLKAQRGMKEQGSGQRVAISFRLWGDPELALFAAPAVPRQPPVDAEWTGAGELTIHVPAKRYPEARSDPYYARVFPGSETAGLVKKREGDSLRRILSGYYFRVPLPEDFTKDDWNLLLPGAAPSQASYRVDPLGRFLYVVYLPDQERPGETIVLRWATRRG
jgi:hypothetical protein